MREVMVDIFTLYLEINDCWELQNVITFNLCSSKLKR